MKTDKKTIILIDEPLENDHRVLSATKAYPQHIIIDCSKFDESSHSVWKIVFYSISVLIKSFLIAPLYWSKLGSNYKLKPKSFISGLLTSMKARYKSEKLFNMIKEDYAHYIIDTIHANDLACGLVGMRLSKYFNAKLIYDAHEVEFHRNRKNSLLRVVYDMTLEQKVINVAEEVIVVNKPIKILYMDIYNISESKITVVDNNHFTPHMGYAMGMFNNNIDEIAIVYVGGGINNRKLESLGQDCAETDVKVHAFFLSKTTDCAYEYDWILGSTNYLPELLELIKKKRLLMWCCTEDICLSYRLSLPNKFFQAIAVGIPVITYKGTYLAEIVQKYNIGYIYDDQNFQEIINNIENREKYAELLHAVSLFQEKLFVEKLEL